MHVRIIDRISVRIRQLADMLNTSDSDQDQHSAQCDSVDLCRLLPNTETQSGSVSESGSVRISVRISDSQICQIRRAQKLRPPPPHPPVSPFLSPTPPSNLGRNTGLLHRSHTAHHACM